MNKILISAVFVAILLTAGFAVAQESKFQDRVDSRVARLENLSAKLENKSAEIEKRLENLSSRMNEREARLQNMSTRVEERAKMIREKINASINFGQCVSDAAQARNDCFNATKDRLKACSDGAGTNSTAKRQCQKDSKNDMNLCKDSFRGAKKDTCEKIKSSFLDRIRHAFD